MVMFLEFASPSTLINILNRILVGAVMFYSIDKFSHIVEAAIYAVAETIIPMITRIFLRSILGLSVAVGLGDILLSLIVFLFIGLLVMKITRKITNYFNSDTILYFIIAFSIIDFLVISGIVLVLKLMLLGIG